MASHSADCVPSGAAPRPCRIELSKRGKAAAAEVAEKISQKDTLNLDRPRTEGTTVSVTDSPQGDHIVWTAAAIPSATDNPNINAACA